MCEGAKTLQEGWKISFSFFEDMTNSIPMQRPIHLDINADINVERKKRIFIHMWAERAASKNTSHLSHLHSVPCTYIFNHNVTRYHSNVHPMPNSTRPECI